MRIFSGIAVLLVALGCIFWTAYEKDAQRHKLEADLKAAQDDATALAKQLDDADAATAKKATVTESLLKKCNAKLVEAAEEVKKGDDAVKLARASVVDTRTEIVRVAAERDAARLECKRLNGDLAAAKKEVADAAKLAMKVAHDGCPPPTNDEPIKGTAKELAPRVQRSNREFAWPEDYQAMNREAVKRSRLLLSVFVTNGCSHCQTVDSDVLPVPRVGQKLFSEFVPCWLMVDSKHSGNYELAESFHLHEWNEKPYPAVVIEDPNSGRYRIFRPAKDPDAFLKQVAAQREKLE